MKHNYLIISIFLAFNFCKAQSTNITLTDKNFENDFLNYKPLQKKGISDKDYEWAQFVISETKKSIREKDGNYNVTHYWNIISAFDKLNLDKVTLEIVFIKLANSDGGCDYITSFKDKVQFDDKIPNLYNQYYDRCLNKEVKTNRFNIEDYILKNNLNGSLLKLISKIDYDDQKYRSSDEQTFKTKQPAVDKKNQILIDSLYNIHKQYIGKSLVGKKFEYVMWSVIQHSNPEMMEKYLPIVHQAVENNELDKTTLKMLIDRFYGLKYGYQVFGSQTGTGYKIANEKTRKKIMKKYGME